MADPGSEADAETQRRIIERAVALKSPAADRAPLGHLIAGPPGSGKSRLADDAMKTCQSTGGMPVHVDSDQLRTHHPDYTRLARTDMAQAFAVSQPFASRWADGLRDAAIDRHLDIVVEGVFKTQANTVALLDRLTASGYEVRLLAKVVPAPVSLLQIERRFERQMSGGRNREVAPRRVDAAAHDVGYRAVEPLVALFESRGLAQGVSLYDLDNQPIALAGGNADWARLVASLRARPLTEHEAEFCAVILAEILQMRVARRAPPAPEPGSALEAAIALLEA